MTFCPENLPKDYQIFAGSVSFLLRRVQTDPRSSREKKLTSLEKKFLQPSAGSIFDVEKHATWMLQMTKRCCFSLTSFMGGLIYLERLRQSRQITMYESTWRSLWVAMMIISEKFWEDNYVHPKHIVDTYASKHTAKEFTQMQLALFKAGDFYLGVHQHEWKMWRDRLRSEVADAAITAVVPFQQVFIPRPIPNLKVRKSATISDTSTVTPRSSDKYSSCSEQSDALAAGCRRDQQFHRSPGASRRSAPAEQLQRATDLHAPRLNSGGESREHHRVAEPGHRSSRKTLEQLLTLEAASRARYGYPYEQHQHSHQHHQQQPRGDQYEHPHPTYRHQEGLGERRTAGAGTQSQRSGSFGGYASVTKGRQAQEEQANLGGRSCSKAYYIRGLVPGEAAPQLCPSTSGSNLRPSLRVLGYGGVAVEEESDSLWSRSLPEPGSTATAAAKAIGSNSSGAHQPLGTTTAAAPHRAVSLIEEVRLAGVNNSLGLAHHREFTSSRGLVAGAAPAAEEGQGQKSCEHYLPNQHGVASLMRQGSGGSKGCSTTATSALYHSSSRVGPPFGLGGAGSSRLLESYATDPAPSNSLVRCHQLHQPSSIRTAWQL